MKQIKESFITASLIRQTFEDVVLKCGFTHRDFFSTRVNKSLLKKINYYDSKKYLSNAIAIEFFEYEIEIPRQLITEYHISDHCDTHTGVLAFRLVFLKKEDDTITRVSQLYDTSSSIPTDLARLVREDIMVTIENPSGFQDPKYFGAVYDFK